MKILTEPIVQIIAPTNDAAKDQVRGCAWAARQCYQSLPKGSDDTENVIKMLIANKHDAMLEHGSFTAHITCDRGITHELVRHRLFSFAQESTRYCNYSKDKFGNEITVMLPQGLIGTGEAYDAWEAAMRTAEASYMKMISRGIPSGTARAVLPTCLVARIVITGNFRQWRHFFKIRALGEAGKPHPQMLQIATLLLKEAKATFPYIFDDLEVPDGE